VLVIFLNFEKIEQLLRKFAANIFWRFRTSNSLALPCRFCASDLTHREF
jgi:hypothetical protein